MSVSAPSPDLISRPALDGPEMTELIGRVVAGGVDRAIAGEADRRADLQIVERGDRAAIERDPAAHAVAGDESCSCSTPPLPTYTLPPKPNEPMTTLRGLDGPAIDVERARCRRRRRAACS